MFEQTSTFGFVRALLIVGLVGAVGLVGCGSTPKPKELKELERILGQEGANEVAEARGARKYYEKSRELRRAALDEWEEGNIELARQYAIRGKIRYRTAAAVKKLYDVTRDANEAVAKVKKINPKVQELGEKRKKLRAEVQALHQEIRKKELEQARARKEKIKQEESGASRDRKLAAQNQIERALEAKKTALGVKANEFAKGEFNRAENELKSAKSLRDSGSFQQATSTAKSAKAAFRKAADKAEPKYEEFKKKQQPKKRLASLREKLESNFGESQIESARQGVRVIIPQLFDEGAKSIVGSKREDLEIVADLAKDFDEFDISIDGFTRKGNATKNLTISQVRAQRVAKFLSDEGIDAGRIDSDGHGQTDIRYPETPSKNDRVEITFRTGS